MNVLSGAIQKPNHKKTPEPGDDYYKKRDINATKNMLYKHHQVSSQEGPEKLTKAFGSFGERQVSVKGIMQEVLFKGYEYH